MRQEVKEKLVEYRLKIHCELGLHCHVEQLVTPSYLA
jgi:hypothetical protein